MHNKVLSLLFLPLLIAGLASCGNGKVKIESLEDLKEKTIGCQSGTTGETFLSEEVKTACIRPFRTANDAALSLKNRQIDAVIIDELLAMDIVGNNNDLELIDLDLASEEYAIAVKKGNQELLDSINRTIRNINSSGAYQLLVNSFMPADGNIIIPEVETLKTKEVVKMGTNAAFQPFEYTNGTEVVGFDATLAKYIANDYNKRLQIIDMAFNSLIDALQSGTIDFIAAGMTVSEERKELVDFSEPYFKSRQMIIVRK